MDAIFSSHNIEHLYPHEVGVALKEFLRVLKPTGFLVVSRRRVHPNYDLYAIATKRAMGEADLRVLAGAHFP